MAVTVRLSGAAGATVTTVVRTPTPLAGFGLKRTVKLHEAPGFSCADPPTQLLPVAGTSNSRSVTFVVMLPTRLPVTGEPAGLVRVMVTLASPPSGAFPIE